MAAQPGLGQSTTLFELVLSDSEVNSNGPVSLHSLSRRLPPAGFALPGTIDHDAQNLNFTPKSN
jgi:hypothetical protein